MIIIIAIVAMTVIEGYALSQGVNGYGLLAFFAGMGGLLGYNVGARAKQLRKRLASVLEDKDE